jgi:hypothetical protein
MTINSEDYEAGEKLTTHFDIVQWMLDGGTVKGFSGSLVYGHDEKGFYSLGPVGDREPATGNFPLSVTWCKAIPKRKSISWEDAVRSLLDGKHVWDRLGVKWQRRNQGFTWGEHASLGTPNEFNSPFFITPPPSVKPVELPKPERRKVSRDDAICAMVRDPEQHCWGLDHEYKWRGTKVVCLPDFRPIGSDTWLDCAMPIQYYYLDPPEEK